MGSGTSILSQVFPARSKFSVEDIPDLTGKIIIVTGTSAGIGKATAKALLAHNAKVYIATYNEEKSAKVISDLKAETGKEAIFLKLDLSDFKSIKAAADEFKSKEAELHVLFNNAGLYIPPIDQFTEQGYDAQFGVNVVGHFYFTQLLLPVLLAGAQSSADKKARVVNTSSITSTTVHGIDFNTLKDSPARQKLGLAALYSQSKLGNILFSNELARRYGEQGIVSTSLHPGIIRSEGLRHAGGLNKFVVNLIGYDISFGALTQLWAGTSPEGAELNGKVCLIPWARVGVPNEAGQNAELAQELWKWSEEQLAQNA
ncbi:hypothetical protein HYPSUDRAFT_40211 [Hypholoma sublateritium FD-334 SS-4]|uniref:NAD(P)-binding protein n=1 Tax=Hypholoma sublateritium (strain FD-334 SS-4) TaxID=945553 RepID=A0A0D2NWD4_HYPSF|nr:hypothetical protein HYPSUDRAFT_40211 [Hypholoma sublateritium FD-334 SS-4]